MRVVKKAGHLMIAFHEDPALAAWTDENADMVDACVDHVFLGDEVFRASTSFYVQLAGDFIWERCDGVDVGWHRFDCDAWLLTMRELPCWTEEHDALAVPTILAFFLWMIDSGRLSKERAAPVLGPLSVHARRAFERTLFQHRPGPPISTRSLD